MRCSALLLLLLLGCAPSQTTVTVMVSARAGTILQSLDAEIDVPSLDAATTKMLPFSGSALSLPGRFKIVVPDVATDVTVTLRGTDTQGQAVGATKMLTTVPHHDVRVELTLGAPGDTLPPPDDLASPDGTDGGVAPDLAGSVDMSGCGGTCAAPKICCGSTCVDPTNDPTHCGDCNTFCANKLCGTTLAATMTTAAAPLLWSFNANVADSGGASYDTINKVAVLTNDVVTQTGSIIYQHAIVTDTFDARFDFRISHAANPPADGMGFVLIKSGVALAYTAVGTGGGGLGMEAPQVNNAGPLLTGYGVEFDTYDNDNPTGRCGETINGDHVNVDTLTPCSIGTGTVPTPLATPQSYTLRDGNWHTAIVHLANGQLSVSVQTGAATTTLFTNVPLAGFTAGDTYYFGFTASTGGFSERHELKNVSVTFPSPRCL